MEISQHESAICILSILFFLPVAFIIVMLLSKDNYNPLDMVNENVVELPINTDSIQLKDHLTVLAFLGRKSKTTFCGSFKPKGIGL